MPTSSLDFLRNKLLNAFPLKVLRLMWNFFGTSLKTVKFACLGHIQTRAPGCQMSTLPQCKWQLFGSGQPKVPPTFPHASTLPCLYWLLFSSCDVVLHCSNKYGLLVYFASKEKLGHWDMLTACSVKFPLYKQICHWTYLNIVACCSTKMN